MKWRVQFAALRSLLVGSDTAAHGQSLPPKNGAISGPAQTAYLLPRPDGETLRVRALRLYNRNDKAAAAYLRTHEILRRGACSDDR